MPLVCRLACVLFVLGLNLAGPAAAQAPQPAAGLSAHTTAFEFLQERQILFPITINGQPAEAWLDSGSSATVIDAGFAARMGLSLGQALQAEGVAGRVPGVRLARADLQLGDLALPGRTVAVMDLTAVGRVVPRPIQVILGRDIFDEMVVDIDFQANKIAFLERASFRPPATDALPLTPTGNLRSFAVKIGGVPTPAILDLGNSGALLVDRGWVDEHGLLKGRPSSTLLSVGADGPRESVITSLDDVQVGGVNFLAVPANVTADLAARAPANVGLALLSRFHVTIDFAGARLWLQPYPGAAQAAFRKNRAGLSVTPEGDHLTVTHVARGSPAARSRWRAGMRIVAIEGQPITPSYGESELSRWTAGPAGRVVALTLSDGSRRLLRLADYY